MSRDATWWIEVDGRVLPRPVAGHPGLELVNTRSGWGQRWDLRQEYLRGYPWLLALARAQEVVDAARSEDLARIASRHPRAAEAELRRAVDLRRDVHDVVTARASRTARARLAQAVSASRARQVLVEDGDGFSWSLPQRPPALGDPLDALLAGVGELLSSPDLARVRSCPGRDCGWLFLDRSGRRRWCRMSVCGNRAKQARHVERTRGRGR
ncbi:CGNR zinc finger domain-containing protein [Janibacter cremeus]|uniref:CGNR zinc finger domain-containing protein n=1 Tax=Janibacter cremeus TaxID=1285192 RepID=UPI0023FA23D1|nr:CGNR zinc finger domain-containing protein [Janibacter cremeus]WEV76867.1 CGNR zinc finger domain-containing protein [Janibacter cremeus]